MKHHLGIKRFWLLSVFILLALFISIPTKALALDSDEINNIDVYAKDAPAVVTVTVDTDEGPSSGAGSIIDPSGIILTSSHILGDSRTAKITLTTGENYTGRVLARIGAKSDLAIIKITAQKPLPFIKLGDSQKVRVGQKVLAIGNPYGFDGTLTLGIISRIDTERNRLQTDASINPGNSGGPLLNTDGEIIGINQSIFNPDGRRTNIGIGFAVPVDTAKAFIKEIATLPDQRYHTAVISSDIYSDSSQDIPVQLKDFSKGF